MALEEPMIAISTIFVHDKALIMLIIFGFAILVFVSLFVEVFLDITLSIALTVIVYPCLHDDTQSKVWVQEGGHDLNL